MDTKQPEALRLAYTLDLLAMDMKTPRMAATELRRQHAEIETLRAGYDAARLEIESLKERVQQLGQLARDVNSRRVTELEAQLAAVGAGGVEPLRKRCLHQISEPAQAQPVASESLVKWASLIELAQTDWHTGYEAARAYVKVQLECATPQPAAPAQAGEYPPLVCDYCGALTPDPWHSSGMMNGKMSKHIHSCDACAAQGAAQAAPVGMEPTAPRPARTSAGL